MEFWHAAVLRTSSFYLPSARLKQFVKLTMTFVGWLTTAKTELIKASWDANRWRYRGLWCMSPNFGAESRTPLYIYLYSRGGGRPLMAGGSCAGGSTDSPPEKGRPARDAAGEIWPKLAADEWPIHEAKRPIPDGFWGEPEDDEESNIEVCDFCSSAALLQKNRAIYFAHKLRESRC